MTTTVLITGSSRGLGATIAQTLATQGFQVIINYHKSKEAALDLVKSIGSTQAIAIQADVTQRDQVDHLVATATDHFGQIDVVVNNALVGFKFDPNAQKAFTELLPTTNRWYFKSRFQYYTKCSPSIYQSAPWGNY